MNQSIHFPDRQTWDEERNAVCFPVLVNGMVFTCAISADELHQHFGSGPAIELFVSNRWDIEEDAERGILNDEIDDQGWFWLSSAK